MPNARCLMVPYEVIGDYKHGTHDSHSEVVDCRPSCGIALVFAALAHSSRKCCPTVTMKAK
eukprot:2784064-Pleurochrysis_carterae.AAC.2